LRPTEQLKEEHRVIEKVLSALDEFATALHEGRDVSAESLEKAADFFSNFADKCHHSKEERHLFPLLEQSGIPKEGGPLGVMLSEHDQARGFVRGMREAIERYAAGDRAAASDIVKNARGYIDLLHHHILKEDNVLYRMAEDMLSKEDQENLERCFHHVEEAEMGEHVHDHYLAIAAELQQEAAKL